MILVLLTISLLPYIGLAAVPRVNATALNKLLTNASDYRSGILVGFIKSKILGYEIEDCEYCERVEPNLEDAYLLLQTDPDYNHQVAIIDCDQPENKEIMKKYKVQNFPSILILSPADDYKGILYRGEAVGEAYASALRLHAGYAPIQLGSVDSLFNRANILMESFVLGMFEDEGELYGKFISASSNLRFIRFYFLLLEKDNKTESTNKSENSVYLVHNPFFTKHDNDSQMMLFDQKKWNGTLDSFILRYLPNTVEICTQQTIKIYRIQGKSYLAFFMQLYNDLNTTRNIGKELTSIMKKYDNRLSVCLSTSEDAGLSHEIIGTKEGSVAIFDANNTMFHENEMLEESIGEFKKKVKKEKLEKWVKEYLEGKLVGVSMEELVKEVREKRIKTEEAKTKEAEGDKEDTEKQKVDL